MSFLVELQRFVARQFSNRMARTATEHKTTFHVELPKVLRSDIMEREKSIVIALVARSHHRMLRFQALRRMTLYSFKVASAVVLLLFAVTFSGCEAHAATALPLITFLFNVDNTLTSRVGNLTLCSREALEFLRWASEQPEISERHLVWETLEGKESISTFPHIPKLTVEPIQRCAELLGFFQKPTTLMIDRSVDQTKLLTDGIKDTSKVGLLIPTAATSGSVTLLCDTQHSLSYLYNICYMQHYQTWGIVPVGIRELTGSELKEDYDYLYGHQHSNASNNCPHVAPSYYPLDMPSVTLKDSQQQTYRFQNLRPLLEAIFHTKRSRSSLTNNDPRSTPSTLQLVLENVLPPLATNCRYPVIEGQAFRAVFIISLTPLSPFSMDVALAMFQQFIKKLFALPTTLFSRTVGGILFDCDIKHRSTTQRVRLCHVMQKSLNDRLKDVQWETSTKSLVHWSSATALEILDPDDPSLFSAPPRTTADRARRLGLLSRFARRTTLFFYMGQSLPGLRSTQMALAYAPLVCYCDSLGETSFLAEARRELLWSQKSSMSTSASSSASRTATEYNAWLLHQLAQEKIDDASVNPLNQEIVFMRLVSFMGVIKGLQLQSELTHQEDTSRVALNMMKVIKQTSQSLVECVAFTK